MRMWEAASESFWGVKPPLRTFAAVLGIAGALLASDVRAQAADDRWSFSLAPYLWLPNIHGTLRYGVRSGTTGSPEVSIGPDDYLKHLDLALLLAGEARKGRWSIVTDVVYLEFSSEQSAVKAVNFGGSLVSTTLNASTSSSLKGLAWTVAGGYAAVQTPQATLDVLGGFRYFGVKASTNWQLTATVAGPGTLVFPASGSVSQREDLWDAIVGVRGRVRLGEGNWFMPYYLDLGTGSFNLTWQGLLGIAYGFRWGDLVLAYRHLYYDMGGDKLIQDMRFSGPSLGLTFRF